jgi:hypothetical protein
MGLQDAHGPRSSQVRTIGLVGFGIVRRLSKRPWLRTILACVSGIVTLATIVWPDWIETITGTEPDGGDGSLEWGLVVVLLLVTAMLTGFAGYEWRRHLNEPG